MLRQLAAALAIAAVVAPLGCSSGKPPPRPRAAEVPSAGEPAVRPPPGPELAAVGARTAVAPKPLGDAVKRGLAWLASHQLDGGGWGQGDEPQQLRGGEPS